MSDSLLMEVKVYRRSDLNGDGEISLGDVVHLLNCLFKSGDPPDPPGAGDANCNAMKNIGDAIYILNYLFKDGNPPAVIKAPLSGRP
jgi:hypothetical protein